jgi:hypothetical protein
VSVRRGRPWGRPRPVGRRWHDRGGELIVEQPAPQRVGKPRDVEGMDRLVAHPEAGQVGRVYRPAAAERLDQGLQRPARGEAMHEDDRGDLELRRPPVGARAVGGVIGALLELGRNPHEDTAVARVRPPPVYAVAARSYTHSPIQHTRKLRLHVHAALSCDYARTANATRSRRRSSSGSTESSPQPARSRISVGERRRP